MKTILLLLATMFVLAGCASQASNEEAPKRMSPTGALMRGELTTEEYLVALKDANEETRKNEQFEVNKEPTRAYNTKTDRIEYVPEGTIQKWNESTQRWEFTPVGN
ncbi:MAG TPA: hypothetical protein VK995_02740 [Oceanipulchritudo sp.]|nr:hypothetical protein [Oceanipulchritudo sp.]